VGKRVSLGLPVDRAKKNPRKDGLKGCSGGKKNFLD